MSFPQSSPNNTGINFRNMTPLFVTSTTVSATLSTVVSVTGKGFVTWIRQYCLPSASGNSSTLKVTIDGVVVINDTTFSQGTTSATGDNFPDLNALYSFKQSLLIEHASAGAGGSGTKVAYMVG